MLCFVVAESGEPTLGDAECDSDVGLEAPGERSSSSLARLTSSSEVVDRRWAVSSGDFWYFVLFGVSSTSEWTAEWLSAESSLSLSTGTEGRAGAFSARGVVTDPLDKRRSVRDRVEELCGSDGGGVWVLSSLTSSKESCEGRSTLSAQEQQQTKPADVPR